MAWTLDDVRLEAVQEDPHRRVHAWTAAHALGVVPELSSSVRERLGAEAEVVESGVAPPLILVPSRGEAWLEGRRVARFRRSRLQYRLLEAIAVHGTTWDHAALYEAVWELPWRSPHTDNALHSAIARLRRAVDADVLAVEVGPLGGFRLEPARPVARWSRGGIGYPPPPPPREPSAPVVLGPRPPALFGREGLLTRLGSALERPGWRTLVGPPGVGKTVLARTVLHQATSERWPGGRVWVDAADVSLPSAVVGRVRAALGQAEGPALVVVDNLEQLQGDPAPLLGIRAQRAGLEILATSRRPVGLSGERCIEVPPLAAPDAASMLGARLQGLQVELPPEPIVQDVVRRTQHLPLALEQVARQVATLGVTKVLQALDRSQAHPPDLTLDLAIGRSWDLLDAQTQTALEHLALYPAGLTAVALSSVAEVAAEPCLHTLVAHHLVVEDPGRPSRYTAYVAVQAWVIERIRTEGRLPGLACEQVRWARARVGVAAERLEAWVWRNVDVALDRALRHTDEGVGDLLAFVVEGLLHHADPGTAGARIDQVLQVAGARVAPSHRSRVLRLRGLHLQLAHHFDEARTELRRALQIADQADDDVLRFEAHRLLANLEVRFDLSRGLEHLRASRELSPADAYHQARYENLAAEIHRLAGDLHAAVRAARRCMRLRRSSGEIWTAWNAQHQLGHALIWAGRLVEARQVLSEVPFDDAPPRYRANWASHHASLELHAGDLEAALDWIDRAESEARSLGLGTSHLGMARIAVRLEQGDSEGMASRLDGARRRYADSADATGLLTCAVFLARLALDQGQVHEALAWTAAAREVRDRTGVMHRAGELELLSLLAEVLGGAEREVLDARLGALAERAEAAGVWGTASRARVCRAALAVLHGIEVDLEPLHASAAGLGDRRLIDLLDALAEVVLQRGVGGAGAVRATLERLEEHPDALTARSFFARFWLDRLCSGHESTD